ncbi:CD209 antigen-like protein E [Geodia barretti]|uniref:CD209 antigen-like protein E n=1 Tax=Geodia barretti TaxID=519541 RepID=A0AA35WKM0_GEOBA|nr:CD209 antigen-like protein E [Geodia barretti]
MAGAVCLLVFCTLLLNTASLTAVRPSAPVVNLTCAGNFTLWELACYSYSGPEVRRSFHQAQRHCSKLRASLASLLSPAEETFVLELTENESSIWIGLTKQGSADRFMWTDGAELSSHAGWREGEPDTAGHLHCAMADRGGWALARGGCASTKLPFVCKKQACPEGLEWGGKDCDVISSPHPPSFSYYCYPPMTTTVLLVLMCAFLSILLVAAYCGMSARDHTPGCHQRHCHNHKLSSSSSLSNSVQDLWLS